MRVSPPIPTIPMHPACQDPVPLPYLVHDEPFNFDIHLTAAITPPGAKPAVVSKTNFKHM
jgi:fumarylacetoacetase